MKQGKRVRHPKRHGYYFMEEGFVYRSITTGHWILSYWMNRAINTGWQEYKPQEYENKNN